MLTKMRGFTLIELLMVSGIAGMLILSWSGFLSQNLIKLNHRASEARQHQQLRAIGFWLSHELERARDNGDWDWVWNTHRNCLLFGAEGGVRLWAGRLQWRGGSRDCDGTGWVALTEIGNLNLTSFELHSSLAEQATPSSWLYLSARINGDIIHWEYHFNGPIQLRQQG